MCDYSLAGLENRLATEGEELVVHRFPTHSVGLASPADLKPIGTDSSLRPETFWRRVKNFLATAVACPRAIAVCIPPGASLILKEIPDDFQRKWNVSREEPVRFVQTSAEVNTYRDAISFRNGRLALLQELPEGMPVKVASLGGDSIFEHEPGIAVAIPRARPIS